MNNRIPILKPSVMSSRFRDLTAAEPSAAAVIDAASETTITRSELVGTADAIAARLSRDGVRRGDALAIQLPNSAEFVAVFMAFLDLGVTAIPIDRDAKESEVGTVLSHFGARGLVYRGESGVEISTREAEPKFDFGAHALVKLTSGSTGNPKGVLTTEKNLIADCTNICSTMQILPSDRNLGAIPFSHSYGFSNLVTPLLMQGTAVVASNHYLPLSIIELCDRYSCTVMPGIPMIFDHLAQTPRTDGMFRTVRTFISAGAPLPASVSKHFRERFGVDIHTFYGCSECGGITYDREGGAVERGRMGFAMDGVTLKLQRDGRLLVTSDAVADGYIGGTPEETERFRDGKFITDDLAAIADSGEVELTGRIGDLINTAGKKVNPREIERVILQIKGVQQVKVYGEPAGARGEVVAAAVVAEPNVSRDEIRLYCREHLSTHKVPRIVKLIASIPVDERGKVKRSALALL